MSETINTQTVVDIKLDIQTRRKYRINGDDNLIIELNPADFGIISRYEKAIVSLNDLLEAVMTIDFMEEPSADDPAIKQFEEADAKARELVNEVFNYDVCSVCAEGGSMFDLCNGKYRFEEIMVQLFQLYDDAIQKEQKKLEARIRKHTDKYTPTDHRKKS